MSRRNALVASYIAPRPDRDSGSRRLDDMLKALQEDGWAITFVTTRPDQEQRYPDALRKRGIGTFHLGTEDLADLAGAVRFDLAILVFWPTAELFLPVLRRVTPRTPVIVDSVDLHLLRHARRIVHATDAGGVLDDHFGDQVVGELNVYAAADAVLTVSPREASLIDDLLAEPGLARVVPDLEQVPESVSPIEQRRGVLFVGSFEHPPNRDAVAWLCRDIVPRLPEEMKERHPVLVVGNGLDADVRALADPAGAVRMVGWVPTVEPWFAAARLSVLPLLSGAGTKRKLIQSLVSGTPAVTTSVGAEGFDLVPGQDILVADDPDTFAGHIIRLVDDDGLWSSLSAAGRAAIARSHGADPARQALRTVIEEVLVRSPKGPRLPPASPVQHLERLDYQYQQRLLTAGGDGHGPAGAPLDASRTDSIGADGAEPDTGAVRLIAFYLPQFHRIPENDAWWGEGFTEWTHVRGAKALFRGHRQPRVPAELGYYDLLDAEVRHHQAELAREHGIHGFCYYHYWFGGKRLLERPFQEVLDSGRPDLPFALCWANEPWSRRWDGSEHEILQAQTYSAEDDLAHIRWLLPALADPRAIRVGGASLLVIYQGHVLPDPARTADIWRTEVARAGLPGLHLLAVETGWDEGWDATQVGFDGKIRFQPQFSVLRRLPRLAVPDDPEIRAYDYRQVWPELSELPPVAYPTYDTVFPGWDNTPRRQRDGWVLHDATPELYERWLSKAIDAARARPPDQRLVFINAWNEWGEGAYLEPDSAYGRGFLEATLRARRVDRAAPWRIPIA